MIPTKRPIPQKPRQTQHAQPQPEAAESDDMPDDGDRSRSKGWIWALCISGAVAIGAAAYFLLKGDDKAGKVDSPHYDQYGTEDYYEPVDTVWVLETEDDYIDDELIYEVAVDSAAIPVSDLPVSENDVVTTVRCIDDYPPAEEAPDAAGYESDFDNKIFTAAEQMPQFPGGEGELMKYISANIKYPPIAMENNVHGKVVVQFVVNRDGTIGDVKVARGRDPDLDSEAVRVVKKLPRFKPGRVNGQPVNVWYTLPITFKLQR